MASRLLSRPARCSASASRSCDQHFCTRILRIRGPTRFRSLIPPLRRLESSVKRISVGTRWSTRMHRRCVSMVSLLSQRIPFFLRDRLPADGHRGSGKPVGCLLPGGVQCRHESGWSCPSPCRQPGRSDRVSVPFTTWGQSKIESNTPNLPCH